MELSVKEDWLPRGDNLPAAGGRRRESIVADERCVVVGAGGISNPWFQALKKEQVRVEAVVDLRLEAAQGQIEKYGLESEAMTDQAAALARYSPDFVIDLTIPEAHCEVTCRALEAGCHVISEKPMAASLAEARRMVRTSEATGRMYMVSQSRRWSQRHEQVRRTLASGVFGDLTTVGCDFYMGCHFGGFRDQMASPLILDMSIHHFDLARFMTGLDPVAVYATEFNPKGSWYSGDASAMAIFELTGGVRFSYCGSWCAEGCHTSWNGDWRFVGTEGTLLYEQDNEPVGQVVESRAEPAFNLPLREVAAEPATVEASGMHGGLCEMLRFLRTGELPQTECHDNIKSLAMVFAVIESHRAGQRVPVVGLEE